MKFKVGDFIVRRNNLSRKLVVTSVSTDVIEVKGTGNNSSYTNTLSVHYIRTNYRKLTKLEKALA